MLASNPCRADGDDHATTSIANPRPQKELRRCVILKRRLFCGIPFGGERPEQRLLFISPLNVSLVGKDERMATHLVALVDRSE